MLEQRWRVQEALDGCGSSGDGARAFDWLFTEHAAFVDRVLRRFGVRPSDVTDARQDVFLVVHRKLGEFEQRASLRTWLYRIAIRVAADYRKRAHRRYERFDQPLPEVAIVDDAERSAARVQLAALLERALDRLPDERRQVFVLYELEELTMPEIAGLLGVPLKTAFSRLYAARREIRAALRRSGYAAPAILLLAPWKAWAASELRTALGSFGASAGAGNATATVTAITPLANATSLAGYASAATAALSHGVAVTSAAGLLAVAVAAMPEPLPETGPMLAYEATTRDADPEGRAPRYHVAPRSSRPLVRERAPVPAPKRPRTRRAPTADRAADPEAHAEIPASNPEPARAAPAPAAAALAPEPRWIRAPDPSPARAERDTARAPAVGLDEVLAATSITPLTRVGPRRGNGGAFTLVPDRAGRARAPAQRGSQRSLTSWR